MNHCNSQLKAKKLVKTVEKWLLGKRGDLHAVSQAAAFVRNEIKHQEITMKRLNKYTTTMLFKNYLWIGTSLCWALVIKHSYS